MHTFENWLQKAVFENTFIVQNTAPLEVMMSQATLINASFGSSLIGVHR